MTEKPGPRGRERPEAGRRGSARARSAREEDARRHHELVVQHSRDAILFMRRDDGRILEANPAATVAYGYGRDELLSLSIRDLRAPETRGHIEAQMREADAGGVLFESLHRRKDGSVFPVEVSSRGVTVDGAHLLISVVRDITDRKRAEDALRASEEALRDSEQKLRASFANAAIGFAITTPDGRFLDANPAYCAITGYGLDELRHQAFERLVHPDDVGANMRQTARMLAGEIADFVVENRYFRKDGTAVWVRKSVSLVRSASGAPQWMIALVEDVTERMRAQERLQQEERKYRSLFENTMDAVYVSRNDGIILDANRAACRMHGMTVEEIRSAGRGGLVVDDDRLARGLERRAREGEARGELTMRRKDGTVFLAEVESVIIEPATGERTAFVTARDVTERRRAEAELRAADQAKTDFLAVLSHELRNPLAPIRNCIYLLEHASPGSGDLARARRILRRQAEHLTRLIDDLLDVTRISRGKVELRRERVDLREIVRETTDDLRSLFEQGDLVLRVEDAPEPAPVDADRTRISQVLGNLLQNAAKFTAAGGAVTVRVGAGEGRAELSVRDTGVGLEASELDRIFEPFSQAHQGLARTRGGLGLGLALVKGLVELHGGSVRAHSDGPGSGCEVVVSLPLSLPLDQHPPPAGPVDPIAAGRPDAGLVIVVIEDNVDAGQSLAAVLEHLGHRVELAGDGRSGVALARELRPDVVLCDIGLPDIDGYEVARMLRRDRAFGATRLLALSGYAQPEDRARALEAGFDAHAAKPLDVEQLRVLVRARPSRAAPP